MATSTFVKSAVVSAGKKKLAELLDAKAQLIAAREKKIDDLARQEMKPKWYRPWRLSHHKASLNVICDGSYQLHSFSEKVIVHILKKVTRLVELAEHAQGDIAMDQDEAALIFGNDVDGWRP